ncbi:profilin [Mycena sp. CBHHK59/15]|nr:profilin [Mycena sp. CBHHK59/15]
MSWQAYVDTNLCGSGKVQKAAILGQQGGVWATSAGYSLSAEEQKAILAAYSNTDAVLASGLKLAGVKFFTVQANDRSIYGKKGADGYAIVKTKQAVLVAEYVAPTQASECVTVVEALADYMISVGY